MRRNGIRFGVAVLGTVLAGCHGHEPVDLTAESAVIEFRNEAKQPLRVVTVLWTGGGEQRASEVRTLIPGVITRWSPFATARIFLAKIPQGSVKDWLATGQPSTDYSLAILRGPRQVTMERFSFYDLQHNSDKPMCVVLYDDHAEFFRGNKVVKSAYVR